MQKLKQDSDVTQEEHDLYYKKVLKEQNSKIEDLQKTQAVLQSQTEPKTPRPAPTIANMALSLLGDLLDECIYDVLYDVHKDMKQSYDTCQICQTKCRHHVQRPGCDIFGKSYNVNNLPSYECVNCQKTIASTRYAPHLEKCLGLAGRQSSRVANRRMGSSPSSVDYSSDSNDDRKRKKLPSSPLLNGSKLKKHRLFDDL
ncbi:uncharacterized protein BX664DRAFT_338188 [Halteromyces radiatus]|uniref:uncharacterized protein n=1 Tax=Halteromyces radiatus TaxID=101107 RepID=UPI00221ECD3E|nr:uncharacterized protein BX664DRAFT_338188 [Halteromyces radiatus]KAI8084958.1 hypothetical protein BX664DRAFT_338188 [Halteromyces radiatus]